MEFLIVAGGLAGAVWGIWLLRQGGPLAGSLAALLLGSVFGPLFWSLSVGPIPLAVDRLLLLVAIAQCLVFRRLGQTNPPPPRKADWALLAFVAVLLLSTLSHDWTFHKNLPLTQVLFYYLLPLALYWVVRQTPLAERRALGMFAAFGAFGLYLALTAIAEWRQLPGLVFPAYVASPEHFEFFGRARGPFMNPAGCGVFQATCLSAAMLWWPHLGRRGKLCLAGVTLVGLLGVYGTLTRSAWIGAMLAVLIVVGLGLAPAWRRRLLVGALVTGTLSGVLLWDSLLAYKRDKNLDEGLTAESAKLRPLLAQVAWNMFLDRPLLGCGYGQYVRQREPYLSDRSQDAPLEKTRPFIQHNVALALLVETGAIGLGLFLMTVWLWGRDAWTLWSRRDLPLWQRQAGLLFLAALAAYFTNGMFHDVTIMPQVNLLLFFLAGVVNQLAPQPGREPARAAAWPVFDRRAQALGR